MSTTDSRSLDNTRKDLIGGVTAVVFLVALLDTVHSDGALDREISAFLSRNSQAIEKLVGAVLSAALATDMTNEVAGTLSELVPRQPGYYDRTTINALLCLYAGEKQLKDFFRAGEPEFHATCRGILRKKLLGLVTAVLWSRVDAYERGSAVAQFDLATIYLASLALVPVHHRGDFESCEDWVVNAKNHWRASDATQRGLALTGGSDSGLTRLLSQF
jgi:hypothetical protein